jgi:hypothetical protein
MRIALLVVCALFALVGAAPYLAYDFDANGRLAYVFTGTVGGAPYKLLVEREPQKRGVRYRLDVMELPYEGYSEYFAGSLGAISMADPDPKNWLGVQFTADALVLDVCDNYDAGCTLSDRITYRLADHHFHEVARVRHAGRPQGADWTATLPLSPSATPPPVTVLYGLNPDTGNNDSVTFRGGIGNRIFEVEARPQHKHGPADYIVYVSENDAFSQQLADRLYLTSKTTRAQNWIGVRFLPDALTVDMCERYDSGCPQSELTTYKIVGLDLKPVSRVSHAGRPAHADWVASQPPPQPTPTPACAQDAYVESWPAPLLPEQAGVRYPNGIAVSLSVRLDALGAPTSVKSDAPPWLRAHAMRWLHAVKFTPAKKDCKPVSGTIEISPQFMPAASGVLGTPAIARGIDFEKFTYDPGPCYGDEPVKTFDGEASYYSAQASTDLDVSVGDVYAGRIGTVPVAVVTLYCGFPVGFNTEARLYSLAGRQPQLLEVVASAAKMAPDSPFVQLPWYYVAFKDGRLYVDAWDGAKRCNAKGDWVVNTYEMRNGKAVVVNSTRHHRAGVDPVLDECPGHE